MLMHTPLADQHASSRPCSEHTRRLASVQANAKFGSAAAGPDTGDLNVRRAHECNCVGIIVRWVEGHQWACGRHM